VIAIAGTNGLNDWDDNVSVGSVLQICFVLQLVVVEITYEVKDILKIYV
jgi:hypothetical protein